MNNTNICFIVDKLLNKPISHTVNEISAAECELALKFSDEYRLYLAEIGFAVVEGHEFTGLCKAKRLNVVDVTKEERNIDPSIPLNWYVIEQLNIDGVVVWQTENGDVYQTSPNTKPKKISESLSEYVNSIL